MISRISCVYILQSNNFVGARKGSSGKGGGSNTGGKESYGKYFWNFLIIPKYSFEISELTRQLKLDEFQKQKKDQK